MEFQQIDLSNMVGREEALRQIKRFKDGEGFFKVMFYRTNDLIHSRRVKGHLEISAEDIIYAYPDFDLNRARTLALVHDDAEIIGGDVMLYTKERMSEAELRDLAEKERRAIPLIVERFGRNASGYDYEALLKEAKEKETLEAQFVSFFDKFDAGGEAWHEVWAGNTRFLRPSGGTTNGKSGGYVRRLNDFPIKYPAMRDFFSMFPHYLPRPFDFPSIVVGKDLHTEESLQEDSGYTPYERWKKSVIRTEGTKNLLTQIEFIN